MEAGQTERTDYSPEQLNKPHQAPGQGAFLFFYVRTDQAHFRHVISQRPRVHPSTQRQAS